MRISDWSSDVCSSDLAVEDALVARLARHGGIADAVDSYFYRLTAFHEEMHVEAFLWTRQTLDYPALRAEDDRPMEAGPLPGDVAVPGGVFRLGAEHDAPFLFDNEKWAHAVEVAPFRIARAPVTNAEYRSEEHKSELQSLMRNSY